MATVLGTKGQVVIERPIRDVLGLRPGFIAVQKVVDDHVEIHFHPPEHDRSLRGILAPQARRRLDPEKWAEVRGQAWAKAAASSGEISVEDSVKDPAEERR